MWYFGHFILTDLGSQVHDQLEPKSESQKEIAELKAKKR